MKALIVLSIIFCAGLSSQPVSEMRLKEINKISLADTVKNKVSYKKSISAIFLGIGGGLSMPLAGFKNNSDVTFGILGRLEFSSTSIFPFVIGGEITYFSYNGADGFKTENLLGAFKTKDLAYGLNIEYSLAKLLKSSFTMPFISADVKSHNVKREFDADANLDSLGLVKEESKISVGAGIGFTMFIFDFHIKYNYIKDMSNIGVYTKMKIPVIRF